MALQAINLPSINGRYELGLSVGINAGVSDDIKLPVLNSGDDSAVYRSMVAFVATSSHFDAWGLRAKQCLAAAVTGICQAKLVRLRGVGADVAAGVPGQLVPDGDWRSIDIPVNATDEQINALSPTVFQNPNMVQSMLFCIAATKANWWAMDHHTGQGANGGICLEGGQCSPIRITGQHKNAINAFNRALVQYNLHPHQSRCRRFTNDCPSMGK